MIAEGDHPPIPIVYQLENNKATVAQEYYVAPKSHALVKVLISKDTQMVGQQVMLSPISNELNITSFFTFYYIRLHFLVCFIFE